MNWSVPLPLVTAAGSIGFDRAGNTLWLAGADGTVATVRLYDRSVRVRGGGYEDPVAVVPLADGLQLAVVERSGSVWAADRQQADRVSARLVWTSPGGAVAAAAGPDGLLLVLTDTDPATVVSLEVITGAVKEVVADAGSAVTLALDDQLATLLLLGPAPAGGALLRTVTLSTGDVLDVPAPVASPFALVSVPLGGAGALVADGTDVRVVAGPVGAPGPVVLPAPIVALTRWGSLLLAVSSGAVHAAEWDLDPGVLPITVEPGLLVRGGWATVLFDPGAAGLPLTGIELIADEGPEAGSVSAGIEPAGADGRQRITLLSRSRTGEFTLRAYAVANGDVLGSVRFRVTDYWPDEDAGPPIAVTGEQATFAAGSWGGIGGPGPQNIPPRRAAENWRVAIVLVDTKGAKPPATPSSAAWVDRLVGGGASARRFYEEISFHDAAAPVGGRTGTTISQSGGVFGPMPIDLAWGELFDPIDKTRPWRGWNPKSTTWGLVAGAFCEWLSDQPGDPRAAVLSATDAVLFIFRNASSGPVMVGKDVLPAQYVWPQALGAQFSWNDVSYHEAPKAMVLMPDGFPTAMPAAEQRFDPGPTLCHELGHTLGLDDLYNAGLFTAEVADRIATDLDLMCSSRPLPDLSLSNRMRLGWITPQWIEVVDFAANPGPRTIALRSVETTGKSGPPPGTRTGVEIRIRDGWNYYFEHRHPQGDQVGDRNLTNVQGMAVPDGRLVLGTDVLSPAPGEPKRPSILLLAKDADGDGPVLFNTGTDYQETDTSNPGRAYDFVLRHAGVDPADPEVIRVSVEHVEARRPQLQVSPAPGGTDFKSPDIDLVGPGGVNALVKGAPHTVLVRVRNVGNVAAKDVLVHLRWLPFTTSAGAWTSLPDPARQTIPPGATRTFSATWTPPADLKIGDDQVEHFCVRVDVDRYVDALSPAQNEITVSDNWAQSNFDATSVSFNSPSSRRRTMFEMANPLTVPATFTTHVDQSSPWYRTYVGQAWQRLQPGERRAVELMYESLAGDGEQGPAFAEAFERRRLEEPNLMAITSRVLTDDVAPCVSARRWWGAALQMRAARRCWFDNVRRNGELVTADVRGGEPDGGAGPVTDGTVNLATWDERGENFLLPGQIGADGVARVLLGRDVLDLIAGGVDLPAMLVRPETYEFARAVSDVFPLNREG